MAERRFTSFVVLAEMRTGSNFLEQNVNQFPDLQSHGELFNPHFIGGPKHDGLFGVTMKMREKDPFQLLTAIKAANSSVIPGFRFFNDHDPRVLERCLQDPACGKVILTRNALDSYVSRKIAAKTGQWKLTNVKHKKSAKVKFALEEFVEHLETTQAFQVRILNSLQESGQTGFYINYDDLQSVEVLNGLGRFLGSNHVVDGLDTQLKRQNAAPIESKVTNFAEMTKALGKIDFMNLSRSPNFEPRRGPGVPRIVLGDKLPLMFIPIKGAPEAEVVSWMVAHEGSTPDVLKTGLNQKELRAWRGQHPGFQAFSVLRHPVLRAYTGFSIAILERKGAYRNVVESLERDYKVTVPKGETDTDVVGAAFLGFLKFLKQNLAGQTSQKIDAAWASQAATLEGVSSVVMPSSILHETELADELGHFEHKLGLAPIEFGKSSDKLAIELAKIYTSEIEMRVRDVYARDYLNFGFSDWTHKP